MLRAVLIAAMLVQAAGPAAADIRKQDDWREIRTANFHLVGDAGERDLRRVAARLEQFRAAVAVLLPRATLATSVPTTVVVFKTNQRFAPFKPAIATAEYVAGYFLEGDQTNYIAVTTDARLGADEHRFGFIYHEFVHLLVRNTLRQIPLWFDEGLAEYYRTLRIESDGEKVVVGGVLSEHVFILRGQLLPVRALVSLDRRSSLYNESKKTSIFYAESWALVHYLLLGEQGKYAAGLPRWLDALGRGVEFAEATRQALGVTERELDDALRRYVNRNSFPSIELTLRDPLAESGRAAVTPLPEAVSHVHAGRLLMALNRPKEARPHFERALALEPGSSTAAANLGAACVRLHDIQTARDLLERAAASPDAPALAHVGLADLLLRSGGSQNVARADAALRTAIVLDATYVDAYKRLALLLLNRNRDDAEALPLLKKAILLAPDRDDLSMALAQELLYRRQSDEARVWLQRLATGGRAAHVRAQAASLLRELPENTTQPAAAKTDAQ
jgi:tetratricopeptide (TPR) repeat protein